MVKMMEFLVDKLKEILKAGENAGKQPFPTTLCKGFLLNLPSSTRQPRQKHVGVYSIIKYKSRMNFISYQYASFVHV